MRTLLGWLFNRWTLRAAGLEDHLGELAHPAWIRPGGQC